MKKVSKEIIGITGSSGALGSHFIKLYRSKFHFRIYKDKIKIKNLVYGSRKILILNILFIAALSSMRETEKNSKKTYNINSSAQLIL